MFIRKSFYRNYIEKWVYTVYGIQIEREVYMEKQIELYFVKKIREKLKGIPIKCNSLTMNGLPDRIVFLPGERVFFAELKDKDKKPRPLQVVAHSLLKKLGFKVYVIDSKEKVDEVIKEWKNSSPTIIKS